MKFVGVIPARFGSTRFPGKPLVPINGKPLLQWVVEGARDSRRVKEIIVATDHPEIAHLAQSLGVECCMTNSDLPSGSDRVWAAIKNREVDVVINIQGDEPLITGQLLDRLAEPFLEDPQLEMATLGRELKPGDLESITTAKIVVNQRQEALYFSRLPIPFSQGNAEKYRSACLKHIGLYAYAKNFLKRFCEQGPVALEEAEKLEQLRALYLGGRIRVVKVAHDSWGVDTPEDVKKIEDILKAGAHGKG